MAIGWFGEDLWDAATDVATSVADRALDVVRAVPGSEELAAALGPLVTGPLRDFANTVPGKIVLRAMATTIYGPLAWQIGPQVASIAFALPGVARGQDFAHAWFDEVRWRAEKTAEMVAPGVAGEAAKGLTSITAQLNAAFPDGFDMLSVEEVARGLGISPAFEVQELARRMGVSAWDAAMARVAMFPDVFALPDRRNFDAVTGNYLPGRQPPSKTSAAALRVSSVTGWEPPNILLGKTSLALAGDLANVLPRAPVPVGAPVDVGTRSPESEARKRTHDAVLAGVIVAAVGAFAWWYQGQEKRRS